jgi:MSHA biogenesis protein MshI
VPEVGLMGWLLPRKLESGWMAIGLMETELRIAHGVREPGARPMILQVGSYPIESELPDAVKLLGEKMQLGRFRCQTLMSSGEYQLLSVEAPNVPPAELKSAVRWRVRGLFDFHIDDATVDVLDIPPEPGTAGAAHAMYAVVARNEKVKSHIDRFQEAQIPLAVIDIAETAQRNIGILCEETGGPGVALLYMAESYCLLTINFNGELYLSRRIELGMDHVFRYEEGAREGVLNRILVEVQRTLDVFERQYHFVTIGTLYVAPEPKDSGILGYLTENLDVAVMALDLGAVVDFVDGPPPAPAMQWKHFHLIGAALRQETKAL